VACVGNDEISMQGFGPWEEYPSNLFLRNGVDGVLMDKLRGVRSYGNGT